MRVAERLTVKQSPPRKISGPDAQKKLISDIDTYNAAVAELPERTGIPLPPPKVN